MVKLMDQMHLALTFADHVVEATEYPIPKGTLYLTAEPSTIPDDACCIDIGWQRKRKNFVIEANLGNDAIGFESSFDDEPPCVPSSLQDQPLTSQR